LSIITTYIDNKLKKARIQGKRTKSTISV